MTDNSPFQFELEQGCTIVTLLPRFNQIPWAEIEQAGVFIVGRLAGLAQPRVLVDLTPLDYMGSAQVALVVRIFKSVKEHRGEMVVATNHPMVLEVLTLAGLNQLWKIVPSRAHGLQRLGVKTGITTPHKDFLSASLACLICGTIVFAATRLQVMSLDSKVGTGAAFIFVVLGFVLALLTAMSGSGWRRSAGATLLIIAVGLLIWGVLMIAKHPFVSPVACIDSVEIATFLVRT